MFLNPPLSIQRNINLSLKIYFSPRELIKYVPSFTNIIQSRLTNVDAKASAAAGRNVDAARTPKRYSAQTQQINLLMRLLYCSALATTRWEDFFFFFYRLGSNSFSSISIPPYYFIYKSCRFLIAAA